jgi:hypothetical protein
MGTRASGSTGAANGWPFDSRAEPALSINYKHTCEFKKEKKEKQSVGGTMTGEAALSMRRSILRSFWSRILVLASLFWSSSASCFLRSFRAILIRATTIVNIWGKKI